MRRPEPDSSSAQASRIRPFEVHLGQWTDEVIARRAGVSTAAVVRFRTALGLPPGEDAADGRRDRLKPQHWMRPLGLIPDAAIVKLGGAPRTGLPRARQILGVPTVEHGFSHLPPWTGRVLDEVPADLPPLLAQARARSGLAEISHNDPRLRLWFAATGTPAKTLAEALDTYDTLDVRPFSRKVYLLRALLAELDGMAALSLPDELCAVAWFVLGRGAPVAIQRYGLDGKPPLPLPEIGPPPRQARHQVPLLLERFDRAVEAVRPWLPALDRALARGAPSSFSPEALSTAAMRFGRTPPPRRRRAARGAPANHLDIERILRNSARFPGVFSVPYALRCLARKGVVATPDEVIATVARMPQVEWLVGRPPDGWFWFPRLRQLNAAVTVIRKILSIGPADLTSFSEGLLRATKRHAPLWVPPEVIAAVAAQLPGVRVEGDLVSTDRPVDRSVLTAPERVAVEFFEREGLEQRHTRIQQAIVAAGQHRGAMALFAQYSPIIRPTTPGRFALVGRMPAPPRGVAPPVGSGWIADWQFPIDLQEIARLASRFAPEGQHVVVRFRRDRRRVEWELCPLEPGVDVYESVCRLASATRTMALAVVDPMGSMAVEGFGQTVEAWRGEAGELQVGEVEACPEGLWLPPATAEALPGGDPQG